MSDDAQNAEEVATRARSGYSLLDRLKARALVTDQITIYTDEPTGKKLGGSEPKTRFINGVEVPDGVRRWGVLGKLESLSEERKRVASRAEGGDLVQSIPAQIRLEEIDAEVTDLLDRSEKLAAKLKESAILVNLQGLPEFVMDEARMAARRALEIEEDEDVEIPEGNRVAYTKRVQAEILSRAVTGMLDSEGQFLPLIDVNEALALPGHLPKSEYRKLSRKIGELQYETSIAENATNNADF